MTTKLLIAQVTATAPQGSWERALIFFERGGPFMWPLLICSIVATTITLERLFALAKYHFANFCFRQAQQDICELMCLGQFTKALEVARNAESPICRIYTAALENRSIDAHDILQNAAQCEIDRLRRGLSLLDTTITVAPMLGILGTVTGTIKTFNVLGQVAMENPLGATAGIAEALITTVAGLAVAIICLFPFNFFVSQLRRRTFELEQAAHSYELAYKLGPALQG